MDDLPESTDPYAHIVDLYDQEHASFTDDIDMLVNFATVVGDPVLELGCGTGRILLPIAQSGSRVTGVDCSRPMLDRARFLADDAGLGELVTLHEGDMTRADEAPGGPFGLVIVSLNSIMHLETQAEQRAMLASARKALDPRGQIIIDTLNPSIETLQLLTHGVNLEGSWTLPDGTSVDKFSARSMDGEPQMMDTRIWYDLVSADGSFHRVRTRFPLRYVSPPELELMLELEGFVDPMLYGSYDLDPLTAHSERLIATADVTHTSGSRQPR